ncbi:MAG: hypothetical protein ABL982_07715 [Vicinamibacterales bacterium]
MAPHNRLLLIPSDLADSVEFIATADVADAEVPAWVEARLALGAVRCENVGKSLVVWQGREAAGAPNRRAFALWYASIGQETGQIGPIPPAFRGTVVFEAINANLQTTRMDRFLNSTEARAFEFRGSHPSVEQFGALLRAWRATAPA